MNPTAGIIGSASGDTVAPTFMTSIDMDPFVYNMLSPSQREALRVANIHVKQGPWLNPAPVNNGSASGGTVALTNHVTGVVNQAPW